MNGMIYCMMVIALLVGRFALEKFMDTTNTKVRFGMAIVLLVIYTGIVQGFLYLSYQDIIMRNEDIQVCYQTMAFVVLSINIAVLFIAIVYFSIRDRRKISEMDKMKLKDL